MRNDIAGTLDTIDTIDTIELGLLWQLGDPPIDRIAQIYRCNRIILRFTGA